MSEYYAVQRSDKYLVHYGIKGMKWGVRKALERNNQKALTRQYAKAQKKLDKLTRKADVEFQNKKARRHAVKAGLAAGVGLAGLASLRGQSASVSNSISAKRPRSREKKVVENGKGVYITGSYGKTGGKPLGNTAVGFAGGIYHPTSLGAIANMASKRKAKEISEALVQRIRSGQKAKDIAIGASVLGLGTAAYQTGKYIASKYRTTKKGHAKAVAKRNAWKSEMNKAFAGTKYKNLPTIRKKQRKYFTKQDFKDAAKAAGLSFVMGPTASSYVQTKRDANAIPANNSRHGKKRRNIL